MDGVRQKDLFERFDDADVRDLIAEYPLAWVAAGGGASLLPLLGEYDGEGRLTHLLGHLGRRNPLHALLAADGRATILFKGPDGYISPAQAERDDWGPTWNYAQLTIAAELVFLPEETGHSIDALVTAMEGERWSKAALGARYDGMLGAIIAFRARVLDLTGRFKLGQDEDTATFAAVLRHHPDAALVRWMRRFAGR